MLVSNKMTYLTDKKTKTCAKLLALFFSFAYDFLGQIDFLIYFRAI